MSTRFAFFAVLLAACSLSTAGLAADTEEWPQVSSDVPANGLGANDAAVIVGISDYFQLPDILGADRTASDWNRYLQKTRGVPGVNVNFITNADATKENIQAAITTAAQKQVKPGGTLWFIYIGHGAPAPSHEDGLILGSDTQQTENSLIARGLAQKDILAIIDAGPQKDAVVIFDACFSGSTGDGRQLVPGSQATVPVKRIDVGAGRSAILSASDVVAGPLPGHDRPAFTYLLLGGMRGWADLNKDQTVTILEAYDYSADVLTQMVRGRSQSPSLRGNKAVVLADKVTEAGPDIVELSGRILPRAEMFPVGPTAPVIDPRAFSGAGFSGNISIAVERARDDALDAGESAVASATTKRDAWCKLSTVDGVNPYKEEASKVCANWTKYVEDEGRLETNLTNDFDVLVDYLDLRRRTPEEKQAAVTSFINAYGKYDTRQEVIAAKFAGENLKNGAPAGIAKDTDGDGLLIDACPDKAEDKDGDHDEDGCPELGLVETVDKAGFHMHALNFTYFRLDLGVGLGFGLWDQEKVPAKFDQVSFRPLLGVTTRLTYAFLEAGLQLDWDLSRDLDDGGGHLSGQVGARVFGIGPWTPSVGVDYRNLFDIATGRAGGPGVYFANTFNFFEGMSGRMTYRYGLEPPGGVVPVHTLLFEISLALADPSGSAFFELVGEICDDM